MMRRYDRLSLGITDVLGGSIVAACLVGAGWLTLVRNNETTGEVDQLKQLIHAARRDARALRAAQEQQLVTLAEYQAELAETGRLPLVPPIEEYFQVLSRLASEHHLRVVQHKPLTSRAYPGMLEQRYAYEVAGATADLVRFLSSIEQTDFWADVSYLKVDRGTGAEEMATSARVAALTISVFSLSPSNAAPDKGGA
jgi:hypothetical protein